MRGVERVTRDRYPAGMAVAVSSMTAAEYLATPESRPEHTELINGTVIVNEPRIPHARVQLKIAYRIERWIEQGERRGYVGLRTDIRINDRNVFAPDVWWVGEDRRPALDQSYLAGQPDLVVEIRSPSTWARDLSVKLPAYEATAVAEAWFVDTVAATVMVFRRSRPDVEAFDVRLEVGSDEQLTSPLLPGFTLALPEVFGR